MKRLALLTPKFVEFIPDEPLDGILYVSMPYATAVHRCCCGCGGEVVTPLTPTDWALTFDGESISLDPSIGNWNFQCQSHYWVTRNKVRWAPRWSREQIDHGRERDLRRKTAYHAADEPSPSDASAPAESSSTFVKRLLRRAAGWLRRR